MTDAVATDPDVADEAQKILDGAADSLPGLEADAKVSILGTAFASSKAAELALGERVELRVVGYVNFVGDQLIENEGKRRIIKVQSSLIELLEIEEA